MSQSVTCLFRRSLALYIVESCLSYSTFSFKWYVELCQNDQGALIAHTGVCWTWRREDYLGCCPQLMVFVEKEESDTSQAWMVKGWEVMSTNCSKESSDSINATKWGANISEWVFKHWNEEFQTMEFILKLAVFSFFFCLLFSIIYTKTRVLKKLKLRW